MRLAITLGLLDYCLDMESATMLNFFSGKTIPPEIGSPQGAILWLSKGQEVANLLKKSASLPVVLIDPFPVKRMHVAIHHCLAIRSYFPINILPHFSPCFPLRVKKGEYALIHPGSGSPTKNYWPQFYRDLADELRRFGYQQVRFVLGPAEEGLMAGYFAGEWVDKPENVEALANLLAGAALYIGNDSGVSHLSGILGTSTIALYKTTDPKVWGALGRKVAHISAVDEGSALYKTRACLKRWDGT